MKHFPNRITGTEWRVFWVTGFLQDNVGHRGVQPWCLWSPLDSLLYLLYYLNVLFSKIPCLLHLLQYFGCWRACQVSWGRHRPKFVPYHCESRSILTSPHPHVPQKWLIDKPSNLIPSPDLCLSHGGTVSDGKPLNVFIFYYIFPSREGQRIEASVRLRQNKVERCFYWTYIYIYINIFKRRLGHLLKKIKRSLKDFVLAFKKIWD